MSQLCADLYRLGGVLQCNHSVVKKKARMAGGQIKPLVLSDYGASATLKSYHACSNNHVMLSSHF